MPLPDKYRRKAEDKVKKFVDSLIGDVPYNKIDHTHCFNQKTPACGIEGAHRCCLCNEPKPEE